MALKEVKILDLPEDTIVGQDYLLFVHPDGTHNKGRVQDIVDDVVSIVEPNFEERLTAAEDAANSVYDQFSLADGLGTFNATSGVATRKEAGTTFTPVALSTEDNGKYFDVVVDGNSSITGVSVAMVVGGKIISRGTTWDYIPFSIGDNTLAKTKLTPELQSAIPYLVEVFNDKYPILKSPAGRMLLWHYVTGVVGGKFDLSLTDIPYDRLPDSVKNGLLNTVDLSFTDLYPIVKDLNGRMPIYGKKDGSVYIPKLVLNSKSILESYLADAVVAKLLTTSFRRVNDSNAYDVVMDDDSLWRGNEFEIPVKTAANTGFAYQQFPSVKTPILKGVNDTGTDLLFRQTCGLPIRGRYYRGDFNPTTSGIVGMVLKGNYGNSYTNVYPAFPAGSTGDCWIIDCGNTVTTKTANSLTFKNGDCLVKTAGGYDIQPGPGNGAITGIPGEFWNITAAGWFAGKYYAASSRILLLGIESQSGPKYNKYWPSKAGELYTMGECSTGFAPASQRDGDLYVFSASGTAQGVAGSLGDILVYMGGWGLITGQLVSVANGKTFFLPCRNANEWAVRRADKSTTEVSVKGKGHGTTIRRKTTDELILFSDSMFGVGVGAKVLSVTGRAGTVRAYGAGTSNDVLAMMRDWLRASDLYKGCVHVMWHGQNNTSDLVQVKNAAHQMAELVGSAEKRFCFWSILGSRSATWNGTRIVVTVQEDAFNSTGYVNEIEKFYDAAYPLQYFSPRKAMMEAALLRTTVPAVQFPGMTEAQVATTYGILPFSYWFDYTGKPFTAANLTSLGYHSAAGLPTGGVDKDYYVRTGNGTVGQIIVNVAGTWTEYVHDSIHLSPLGQDVAASKFSDYLTLHNI